MKRYVLPGMLLLIFTVSGFRSDHGCSSYELLSKGTSWVWTEYDGNGKILSYTDFSVINVKTKPSKVEAIVNVSSRDTLGSTGKPLLLTMTCDKGTFKTSLTHLLIKYVGILQGDPRLFPGEMIYPPNIKKGDTLKAANCSIASTVGPGFSISTDLEFSQKICDTIESRSTMAGKWTCCKLEYTTTMSGSLPGGKQKVAAFNTIEWFSEHVGTVRLEQHQKGKLVSYSELTSITYPK